MSLKTLRHYAEYYLLLLFQRLVSLLPRTVALSLGALAGQLLYFFGAYRSIVQKNMDLVNLWPHDEVTSITKRLYRNMGRYAVDFLRTGTPKPPCRVHGFEHVALLREKGRGVIVLLAHFGNWELLADLFGARIAHLHVVAKPMKNPLVDAWLARKRNAAAVRTIFMVSALRQMLSALRNNDLVAVLIDQRAGGGQGTPAPFLGKKTATVRTVAGLVRKTGCGVLPVYAIMQSDGSYDIVITSAEPPDVSGTSDDEAISAIQAQHNEIIGSWIRQYPDHWFGWFHKRFKEHVRY